MDSGEFTALDLPEDRLKIDNTELRAKLELLRCGYEQAAVKVHKAWHRGNPLTRGRSWEDCNWSFCRTARQLLSEVA